jgi:hypothetical protein
VNTVQQCIGIQRHMASLFPKRNSGLLSKTISFS